MKRGGLPHKQQTNMDTKNRTTILLLVASLALNAVLGAILLRYRAHLAAMAMQAQQPTKKEPNYFTGNHMARREAVFRSTPKRKEIIVFIGDSQTAGYPFEEVFGGINRGIGGDTTGGVMRRMSEAAAHRPDFLFMQVGVNDLMGHRVRIKRALENVRAAIDTVRLLSPNTEVFVQSIFPVSESYGLRDSILAYNMGLEKLTIDKKARFVDLYSLADSSGFLRRGFDMGDGVHLTLKAYGAWCDKIGSSMK